MRLLLATAFLIQISCCQIKSLKLFELYAISVRGKLVDLVILRSMSFHTNCRGGGELLKRLHALAEAEVDLDAHMRKLSEIESEVKHLDNCRPAILDS